MAIKPKSGPTIVARSTANYNPATFHEYVRPEFKEVSAEELLAQIKPLNFDGKLFISVDTETYYTGVANNRLPGTVVRRWIKGSSSSYIPNDFPFCISICDGTHSFVVYDTLQNKFAEFKKLEAILLDTSINKVFQNAGFDMHMLANSAVNMKGRIYDTLLISKLTRANAYTHNLFDIAKELQEYKGLDTVLEFELMVKALKASSRITDYRQIPRELMTQYTCADTWNTLIAFIAMYPSIAELEVQQLFDIESEMLVVAYNMERPGIKLDAAYEHVLIPELIKEVEDAEREIYAVAGTTFNINSSQQLEAVLISLGYGNAITYRPPTENMRAKGIIQGNPKFDAAEMERLENEGVPLIAKIQQYKASLKLLNTFAVKLYEMMDFNNNVHCNFNTIEAKTGRFSISAPSMQNMPRRKDDRVRGAFIAEDDYELYDFDFKSQESIILAHYSRAEYLLELIRNGVDAHKATASIVFGKPVDEVTSEERGDAKSVGFAVTYGAGASKVATMTHKSLAEAQYIIKTYMRNIPEVDAFIKTANKVMKERGRIKTILGRQVYSERGREYACVNYIIQGCQLHENAVLTTHGYSRIKDLSSTDNLLTLSGPTNNYRVYDVGAKPVWELVTTHHRIKTSPEHRFGVYHNGEVMYVELSDIYDTDYIYAPMVRSPQGTETKFDIHYLMGYILGDGCARGHYVTVCGGEEKMNILKTFQATYTNGAKIVQNKGSEGLSYQLNIARTDVMQQLWQLGLTEDTAKSKSLPDYYLTAPTDAKVEVLKGLWDSDGGYSGQGAVYTTISEDLAVGVHRLMNSIGILTKLRTHEQYSGQVWRVHVDTASIEIFSNVIGTRREAMQQWLDKKLKTTLRSKDGVPAQLAKDCFELIYNTDYYGSLSRPEKSAVLRFKAGSASRASLLKRLAAAGLTYTEQFKLLCKGAFSKVVTVTDLGYAAPMCDIEILDEDHSYIAEGLANHNSAADSTKDKMVKIYKFLRANEYKTYMVLQVHDSLLQSVHKDEKEYILGYLRWLQTERDLFRVPITVDVGICSPTWKDKQDIEVAEVKPPQEQLDKMTAYNIWEEGLLRR